MSTEARIGGVTVRFNEDGTLFIYQPDASRIMSPDYAEQLYDFIAAGLAGPHERWLEKARAQAIERSSQLPESAPQSTVPAGVINTSEGAVETEPANPAPRRGRPRKAQG